MCLDWGVALISEFDVKGEVDDDNPEEIGSVAAAWTAASFSNFLISASCCRSDIGVWHGVVDIAFVDCTPLAVGEAPLLFKLLQFEVVGIYDAKT